MANEFHTMPLKVEKLLSSQRVRLLALDEFGAFVKLLCDAWLNGGYLEDACSSAGALQRLYYCDAETAERIRVNVLEVFFEQDADGRWFNAHQQQILADVEAKSKKNTRRASAAAKARWGCSKDAGSSASRSADAVLGDAIQSQSQSQSVSTPPTPSRGSGGQRFVKPTLEEVQAYCRERKNQVDAVLWLDHYTANGWMTGRTRMKDWRSAVRTWERNGVSSQRGGRKPDMRSGWQAGEESSEERKARVERELEEYRQRG